MAHTKIGTYAVNAYKPKNLLEFSVLYNSFQTVYYVAIPKNSKPEYLWIWDTNTQIFKTKVFPTEQFEKNPFYTSETVKGFACHVRFNKKNVKRAKPNSKEFIKYDAKHTFIKFVFIHPFEAVRNLQIMFYKDQQIIKDIMRQDDKSRERMFHTETTPSYWDYTDL